MSRQVIYLTDMHGNNKSYPILVCKYENLGKFDGYRKPSSTMLSVINRYIS